MSVRISFIVIARNQVATIEACLESVFRAARVAAVPSFETIYVDSASTDGSVASVLDRFRDAVRIVRLTGAMNAAIARNVGASVATGDVLFFVDGDMELDPGFLREALGTGHWLVHPVVTGQLPEKTYDRHGRFVADAPDRYRIRRREFRAELGGVFVIDRALFETIGGFTPELRCNEDLDLGLRLARAGTLSLALPHPIALHHTVEYLDWTRILPMIRDGSLFYPSVLFRRHIGNAHYLPVLASRQRPTAVMLISVLLGAWFHPAWLALFFAYVGVKNLHRRNVSFLQELVGTGARSICFLVGLVCFHPHPVPRESVSFTAV